MAEATGSEVKLAVEDGPVALALAASEQRCVPGAPIAAVILAAGEGSRLGRPSKPLTRVAGVTLLERAVSAAREAGVGRVVVVIGHAKEDVARFATEHDLDVEIIENDDFSAGNGSSAVVGAQLAGERFLLMMCDHLVEPGALARMIACEAPFAVAIDTRPAHANEDEATKIRVADGAVVGVGRDLDEWNAVDAGVFICTRSVVETAEEALARGEGTWNAVKRRWIEEGRRLEAVDIAGSFWFDVDTPHDARRAERLLLARAAAKPLDGVVSRRLNRPLSRRISALLLRLHVSPTSASVATFALGLVAAALVAVGAVLPAALVIGGLFVQLASVVDGCDGEIARVTLRTSRFGALLDTLLDRIVDVALLAALAIAAGFRSTTWTVLAVAVFVSMFVPYVKAAFESAAQAPLPSARAAFGRDARMLVIAVGAIALQPLAALVVVAALSVAEGVARTARALRAARVSDARR